MQIYETIRIVSGEKPKYKNSLNYQSRAWCEFEDLTISTPVQRQLCNNECVFDLDGVSEFDKKAIPEWLAETGLKFLAWESSDKGLHIHFWTDLYGKRTKINLVQHMAKAIKKRFGVTNDILPMNHGIIRAEYSIHPIHGKIKRLIFENLPLIEPINHIPSALKELVKSDETPPAPRKNDMTHIPECMKYILNTKFTDGRQRLVFVLASWFHSCQMSPEENERLIKNWCAFQNYYIQTSKIKAFIRSTNGTCGCNFRHRLLEEIGVVVKCNGK